MIKISIIELIITWICLSVGIIMINFAKEAPMSVPEIASAIYFMGMYTGTVILGNKINEMCNKYLPLNKEDTDGQQKYKLDNRTVKRSFKNQSRTKSKQLLW